VHVISTVKKLTNFLETWYDIHTTGEDPNAVLSKSPTDTNNNMVEAQACDIRATGATSQSSCDVWQ
jgi:hypothetical protein